VAKAEHFVDQTAGMNPGSSTGKKGSYLGIGWTGLEARPYILERIAVWSVVLQPTPRAAPTGKNACPTLLSPGVPLS
jgi:hypothetical protein